MTTRATMVKVALVIGAGAGGCSVPVGEEDVASTSSALGGPAAQLVCQDCAPFSAVVKLSAPGKGTFCSGGLISSRRVLTSAKCLTDVGFGSPIQAVNITQSTDPGPLVTVSQTFVHPGFTGTTAGFDAAVLELASSFPNSGVSPIPPFGIDTAPVADGTTSIISAYGFCNPTASGTKQLAAVTSVATSVSNYIAEVNIQLCSGDFGGVVLNAGNSSQIVGIASLSQFPANLITRTQPIRSWILSPTRRASAPDSLGSKFFINRSTGKCMQANSGGTVSEAYCGGQTSHRWYYSSTGVASTNLVRSAATGLCLATGGSGGGPRQVTCNSNDAGQQWFVASTGFADQLTNRGNGRDLIAADTGTLNFATVTGDTRRLWVRN